MTTVNLIKDGIVRIVPENKVEFWENKGYEAVTKTKNEPNGELEALKIKADKVGMSYKDTITLSTLNKALEGYLSKNPEKAALLVE